MNKGGAVLDDGTDCGWYGRYWNDSLLGIETLAGRYGWYEESRFCISGVVYTDERLASAYDPNVVTELELNLCTPTPASCSDGAPCSEGADNESRCAE